MSSVAENNKRIAKNTVYLYIRLLFAMAVGLYTSRVVLATLGEDDFGLNAVVTSAITIFFFLNSSMASATSRFLTFELGKDDAEKLKKTFSAALTIHIIIAIIILVLGETVGLWYLENKMVVPEGRMTAARWVYHLSLASAMFTITQVPYSATLIARERMNIYAYIEILQTCLKLGIVFLLVVGKIDKLILYAILTLCVTIIVTITYRIYCIRHFSECRYKFHKDKEIIYPMLTFSGWNLIGSCGNSIHAQGIPIILNLFFSTVVNAAYGLATQLSQSLYNLSTNLMTGANPQIIKYYAANKITELETLVINVSKYSFLLLFAFCLPMALEMDILIAFWLKNPPAFTSGFTRLMLAVVIIDSLSKNINMPINATGKVKLVSCLTSIIHLLIPVCTYLLFKFFDFSAYIVFVVIIICYSVSLQIKLVILKRLIPNFIIINYYRRVLVVIIEIVLLSAIIPIAIYLSLPEGLMRLIILSLVSLLSVAFFTYYIALNCSQRQMILANIFKITKMRKV